MGTAEQNDGANDAHSFVIRLRVNEPVDLAQPGLKSLELDAKDSDRASRLIIRIEHVNSADLTLHHSISGALDWLGNKMRELTGSSDSGGSSKQERGPWTH